MLQRLRLLLTTWVFLLCLICLLVNDFWLKQTYPGLLTGKLSDFAGIAVVTMLALSAWPTQRLRIFLIVSALFAWWKSPLSQPAIALANIYLPMPIGRIVDYSDLLALLVMPGCVWVQCRLERFTLLEARARRKLAPLAALLTAFAVSATSIVPPTYEYVARLANPAGKLDRGLVSAAIEDYQADRRRQCADCGQYALPPSYLGVGLELRYHYVDARTLVFTIRAVGKKRAAREVVDEVMQRLTALHPDLKVADR